VLHLPSIQGGAQITIYVRLGNPFGERNGELLPLEHCATLQGADEVGEIGDETMVDSCSDDKTGRRGLTPSCHAPVNRGTQRDARRHTGKPTEPPFCKTPKRHRQRRETTTLAGGCRTPPEQPSDEKDRELLGGELTLIAHQPQLAPPVGTASSNECGKASRSRSVMDGEPETNQYALSCAVTTSSQVRCRVRRSVSGKRGTCECSLHPTKFPSNT
jgi:hypothetical protein